MLFSEIDTLFSVPLDPVITNGCDSGQPIVITHPESSQVILIKKIYFRKMFLKLLLFFTRNAY